MLVSIIMPNYNTPYSFVEEAINSILKQSHKDFELLIIDDHSTAFCEDSFWSKIISSDKRIKFYKNKHSKGVAGALNTGLDYASGKYVFRMDADDLSSPNRLKMQIDYLEKHLDVSILSGYAKCFGESFDWHKSPKSNISLKTTFLFNGAMVHPTICFRKSFLDSFGVRYKEGIQNEDYELWTRLAVEPSIHFSTLKKKVLNYRVHDNQVTQTKIELLKQQGIDVRKKYILSFGTAIDDETLDDFVHFSLNLLASKKMSSLKTIQKKVFNAVRNSGVFHNSFSFRKTFWMNCLKKTINNSKVNHRQCFSTLLFDAFMFLFC